MYGFVTDSPLFDNPGGFNRALTNEESLRLRASAQQAIEAGRPMTMAEMYGKPQQLFRQLSGFDGLESAAGSAVVGIILGAFLASKWGIKLFPVGLIIGYTVTSQLVEHM